MHFPSSILLAALSGTTALALPQSSTQPSPPAAKLINDLEVYFNRAVDLQTALSRFRTSDVTEGQAVLDATKTLKVTIDQLDKDVNGAKPFSESDSTAVSDTWLSHLNIDASYIIWFGWEEKLFDSVGLKSQALDFLKGTNNTLYTLLPVVRSKVYGKDKARIADFQENLTKKVTAAIQAYN